MIPDVQPLALRVPYATISYRLIGSTETDVSPTINFAIENVVSMDDAIRAVEVMHYVKSSNPPPHIALLALPYRSL